MAEGWYLDVMGEHAGPFSIEEFRDMGMRGTLSPDANVKFGIDGNWTIAASVPDLFPKQVFDGIRDAKGRQNNRPSASFPILTCNEFVKPGWSMTSTGSVVLSRRVFGINAISEMFVGMRDTFGGRSKTLESSFESMEKEVLEELSRKALKKGAAAIVGLKLQHGVIESQNSVMLYVTGQGTPITLERDSAGGIDIDEMMA